MSNFNVVDTVVIVSTDRNGVLDAITAESERRLEVIAPESSTASTATNDAMLALGGLQTRFSETRNFIGVPVTVEHRQIQDYDKTCITIGQAGLLSTVLHEFCDATAKDISKLNQKQKPNPTPMNRAELGFAAMTLAQELDAVLGQSQPAQLRALSND